MTYRVELQERASYLEAHVLGAFGGVAEAVRMYNGIARECVERGQQSLLIIRDHTIAPNPEEGRLLMAELTRLPALAALRIAYVVPHVTQRVIELSEFADAIRKPMWRLFNNLPDATHWLSNAEIIAERALRATGADFEAITKKR